MMRIRSQLHLKMTEYQDMVRCIEKQTFFLLAFVAIIWEEPQVKIEAWVFKLWDAEDLC